MVNRKGVLVLTAVVLTIVFGVGIGDCEETIDTPKKLEAIYKEVIDDFNRKMLSGDENEYRNLEYGIRVCTMSGKYVMASFMCYYLHLLHRDLLSMAKTDEHVRFNTRMTNYYKDAIGQIMQMCNPPEQSKKELMEVLGKVEKYYMKTKTRITNFRK
ncbi:MAG: hypothetical protein C4576_13700 [Desulfobacteraceae bacterium]|nr:MAG: hypothetical protein C4576_13700 [Desulfobacteraceae bacterium]